MDKTSYIRSVFSKIPQYYDVMNDAMSLGMHRIWKRRLVAKVNIINKGNYLDLSTGSGDIAKLILQKTNFFNISIICADPDADMLKKAEIKLIDHGFVKNISFVQTAAEKMPFENGIFDVVTLSFGLRNFSDICHGLSEIFRVLKPGGKLYCLEFSPKVKSDILQKLYNGYLNILPKIGKIIAKDQDSYEYLSNSIKDFQTKEEISDILQKIGFSVDVEELSNGICSIFIAQKK